MTWKRFEQSDPVTSAAMDCVIDYCVIQIQSLEKKELFEGSLSRKEGARKVTLQNVVRRLVEEKKRLEEKSDSQSASTSESSAKLSDTSAAASAKIAASKANTAEASAKSAKSAAEQAAATNSDDQTTTNEVSCERDNYWSHGFRVGDGTIVVAKGTSADVKRTKDNLRQRERESIRPSTAKQIDTLAGVHGDLPQRAWGVLNPPKMLMRIALVLAVLGTVAMAVALAFASEWPLAACVLISAGSWLGLLQLKQSQINEADRYLSIWWEMKQAKERIPSN